MAPKRNIGKKKNAIPISSIGSYSAANSLATKLQKDKKQQQKSFNPSAFLSTSNNNNNNNNNTSNPSWGTVKAKKNQVNKAKNLAMDNFPTLKTAPKKNAAATKSNNSNKKNNNSQQHVYAAAQDYFSNKQKLQQQQQQQDQSQFCIRNSLATGALSSTMDQYY